MRTSLEPEITGMLERSSVPGGTTCWRTSAPFTHTSRVEGVAAKAVKAGARPADGARDKRYAAAMKNV